YHVIAVGVARRLAEPDDQPGRDAQHPGEDYVRGRELLAGTASAGAQEVQQLRVAVPGGQGGTGGETEVLPEVALQDERGLQRRAPLPDGLGGQLAQAVGQLAEVGDRAGDLGERGVGEHGRVRVR